jgi:hypothetical protein
MVLIFIDSWDFWNAKFWGWVWRFSPCRQKYIFCLGNRSRKNFIFILAEEKDVVCGLFSLSFSFFLLYIVPNLLGPYSEIDSASDRVYFSFVLITLEFRRQKKIDSISGRVDFWIQPCCCTKQILLRHINVKSSAPFLVNILKNYWNTNPKTI